VRTLKVFSRQGCHLCELLVEELVSRVRGQAAVDVVDVDRDAALCERYGLRVPVVALEGRVLCEYRLDWQAVEAALKNAAADQ
jgi:hypothetical protein